MVYQAIPQTEIWALAIFHLVILENLATLNEVAQLL